MVFSAALMTIMQTNQFQKLDFEVVQAIDGSSMSIDISLPSLYARATIGSLNEGGYCDTEILDAETSELTYWQHHEFSTSSELDAVLTNFFHKLRDLPTTGTPTRSFELPLADKKIRLNALLDPLLTAAGQ